MQLDYLKYLLTLQQLHSLTKTADAHYISRQSLAKNLASLETELNQKLYFTKGKKIYLTPAGEIVADFAHTLIESEEIMNKKLSLLNTQNDSFHLDILSFSAISNYCINHIFEFSSFLTNPCDISCKSISPTSLSQTIKVIRSCTENIIILTLNNDLIDPLLSNLSDSIYSYNVLLEDRTMLCASNVLSLTMDKISEILSHNTQNSKVDIHCAIYSMCIDDSMSIFHRYTHISSDTEFIDNLLFCKNMLVFSPYYLATKAFNKQKCQFIKLNQQHPLTHLILFKEKIPFEAELTSYIKKQL